MINSNRIFTIINAVDKGYGFKTNTPLYLHNLLDKNLLERMLDYAEAVDSVKSFLIVSNEMKNNISLKNVEKVTIVCQDNSKEVAKYLLGFENEVSSDDLILFIDALNPLLKYDSIRKFALRPVFSADTVFIITSKLSEPKNLRRVIRDSYGNIIDIKSISECNEEEKNIKEVELKNYLLSESLFFEFLRKICNELVKEDLDMDDLKQFMLLQGRKFVAVTEVNEDEVLFIDNENDLVMAMQGLWKRKIESLSAQGVIIMDRNVCYINDQVNIGIDTILYPNVLIEGKTDIGRNCIIYPGVRIRDCKIGNNVRIYDNSVLEQAIIEDEVNIGPFARIRPESYIMEGARIGNFVELKKTKMGKGSKANHLSYLGDAIIGDEVNIGAGTITCNYDGVSKHQTIIEDGVFVGSDTQFVAPVHIHKGAYIAAGSTITKNVPAGALGIARGKQENKLNWVKRKTKKKSNKNN